MSCIYTKTTTNLNSCINMITHAKNMSDNIQVIVRCRARNSREIASKSPNIIGLPNDVYSQHEPFVCVNHEPSFLGFNLSSSADIGRSQTPTAGKVYKVDQVYGPNADQALIFDNVVIPLFHDFVNGMNVTILAYGQTGSGKTYTMCGDLPSGNSGLIPRVLTKLFKVLQGDYYVKLSCVELYKEDLRDLIADDVGHSASKAKLRLVSDNANKGAIVQNLTEVHIDSCEMGFKILRKCLEKRQTSATKLNDMSSRSHTLFTITLCKQSNVEDTNSDYCVSRMNLVDLAGSEDINKSGAMNERAREAGLINQSLLSLGKVISSLSEGREPRHIPYRESKLTRLLQGSIGGMTRTALIATISPAKINAHETISTLNYASMAKSIRNLPQSSRDSEMVLKKVVVSDLSTQIARITRDLLASKEKDGTIKMSVQNYDEYKSAMAGMESDLQERAAEVESLKARIQRMESEGDELRQQALHFLVLEEALKAQLVDEKSRLASLELRLAFMKDRCTKQNDQIAKIMMLNLSDLKAIMEEFTRIVAHEKSQIGDNIDSLKFEIAQRANQLRDSISCKTDDALKQMHSQIVKSEASLTEILKLDQNFESISRSQMKDLIEKIQNSTIEFAQKAELALSLNSTPLIELMEESSLFNRSQTEYMKENLLSTIGKAVETILEDHMRMLNESMKQTSANILSHGATEIRLLANEHTSLAGVVLEDMHEKETKVKNEILATASQYKAKVNSTLKEVSNRLKDEFTEVMTDLRHDALLDDCLDSTLLDQAMCSAERGLENMKKSVSSNYERAQGTLNEFERTLTQIESASDFENLQVLVSPSKRERRSPLRLPVKKRKPMSPLKENNGITHNHAHRLGVHRK